MPVSILHLGPGDLGAMRAVNALFGDVFEDGVSYHDAPPSDAYLSERLADPDFVVLAAMEGDTVVGALAAYVLRKFERERAEAYIYDLAVAESHRRQGVATALIRALKPIAKQRGAYVIFVQADPPDLPAVKLYESLGLREDVLHFDIGVD